MDRFLNFTLFIQKKKNRKNIKKMYFIVKKTNQHTENDAG